MTGLTLDIKGDFGRDDGPAMLHLWGSRVGDTGGGLLKIISTNQVVIDSTNPAGVQLHVNGDAQISGNLNVGGAFTNSPSDRRLKRDIKPLEGALDSVLALRGVSFEWASGEIARRRPGRQTGFIADEVERVFPNWVLTGPDGMKTIAYPGFEALVVEALRELAGKVEALAEENRRLREQLARGEPEHAGPMPPAAARRRTPGKAP